MVATILAHIPLSESTDMNILHIIFIKRSRSMICNLSKVNIVKYGWNTILIDSLDIHVVSCSRLIYLIECRFRIERVWILEYVLVGVWVFLFNSRWITILVYFFIFRQIKGHSMSIILVIIYREQEYVKENIVNCLCF